MVTFFTITLCISVVGIVSLLTLKQIELSTGRVILAPVRPKINRFFKTILLIIERVLPALARESLLHMLERGREALQKLLAHAILWVEVRLQQILRTIREKTHPSHVRGEASAFLKEVGEYKKQIEIEQKEEGAIFDESVQELPKQ